MYGDDPAVDADEAITMAEETPTRTTKAFASMFARVKTRSSDSATALALGALKA